MNVVPLGCRLLVRRMEEETHKFAGKDGEELGIVLAPQSQDHGLIGEVIAIGETVDATIEIGDVVLFGRYAGQDVKRNMPIASYMSGDYENVMLMVDEDILAIVCKDEDLATIKQRIEDIRNLELTE